MPDTQSGGVNINGLSGSLQARDLVGRDSIGVQINLDAAQLRGLELTGSRLPARNPLFVGRAETLAELAARLDADGALVVLTGPGGMGKTQTAIEFGHLYAAQFPGGVFWLRCAQPEVMASETAACGSEGRIPFPQLDNLPQPDRVALVQREWGKPIARLLIFDNVEDEAVLKQWRPTTGGCRVLVTARREHWPSALTPHVFSLPQLARADSLRLLAHAPRDETRRAAFAANPAANAIADSLGDLPLALHLAGAYMAHYGLTPAQYLAELRAQSSALEHESLKDWLAQNESLPTEHIPNVVATFELSYRKLLLSPGAEAPGDESPKAKQSGEELGVRVFHLLAHCAPAAPLPREVLKRAAKMDDDKRLTDALRALSNVGLITLDSELRPIVHRLVQEFAQLRIADSPLLLGEGEGVRESLASLMEIAIGGLASEINKAGLPKEMAPLLPHLRTLAERAEARRAQNAGGLFNELGCHLHEVADYAAARAAFERALAIDEKTFGPDHPNVAIRVNNLGMVHKALSDLPAARAAFERALARDEKTFGPDHPNVAIRVNNLGSVYQDMGDLPAARAAFERALAIGEKTFGPDHPNVAIPVNNLGKVLQQMGDLPAARASYERALKFMEKYAPNSPGTKIVRENLERVMGEAQKAEDGEQ